MNLLYALEQSGQIHRLGWGLVHSLWLGMAIAGVLAWSLWCLRGRSANARYLVCCGAMLALLAATVGAVVLVEPLARAAATPADAVMPAATPRPGVAATPGATPGPGVGVASGNAVAAVTQAATQAALSSKPVEKAGLQVTVVLPKATFAADEPLKFMVQFKNVSDKPFALNDVDWFWAWSIRFEDMATNGPWQLELSADVKRPPWAPRVCKPGETVEVAVDLGKGALPHGFAWEGAMDDLVPPLHQLHPGKYRLTIEIPATELAHSQQEAPFWTGTIKTEPVEFEISDKAAATQAGTRQPVTATAATTAPAMTEKQVVAEITKLGAKFRTDGDKPGRPVVAVNFDRGTVTDAVLEHLQGLPQFRTLDLDWTRVTDAGMAHLAALHQLQSLSLQDNPVNDAGLEHVAKLNQLQALYLARTKVTDAGMAHLAALHQLQTLYLDRTDVGDAGMEHLKGLSGRAGITPQFLVGHGPPWREWGRTM